jgi:hypothetical protein
MMKREKSIILTVLLALRLCSQINAADTAASEKPEVAEVEKKKVMAIERFKNYLKADYNVCIDMCAFLTAMQFAYLATSLEDRAFMFSRGCLAFFSGISAINIFKRLKYVFYESSDYGKKILPFVLLTGIGEACMQSMAVVPEGFYLTKIVAEFAFAKCVADLSRAGVNKLLEKCGYQKKDTRTPEELAEGMTIAA